MNQSRLTTPFYEQDVLMVAPGLIGKHLIRVWPSGEISRYMITETEAYRGIEDKACHASKGKTKRTQIMYEQGGVLYMYLIYGMYWMMNVVTSVKNVPQAVLIRGTVPIKGPGRLTRELKLDKNFNGEDLTRSKRIWIEDSDLQTSYNTSPRIGVEYAGEYWKNRPWRYLMNQ